jgi:hypothetical protein
MSSLASSAQVLAPGKGAKARSMHPDWARSLRDLTLVSATQARIATADRMVTTPRRGRRWVRGPPRAC